MYTWFVTGSIFSSLLLLGNKYAYASSHRHTTLAALLCVIGTYAVLFLPDVVASCDESPVGERVAVFLVLIAGELLRTISGSDLDITLPCLVCAHVIAAQATHLAHAARVPSSSPASNAPSIGYTFSKNLDAGISPSLIARIASRVVAAASIPRPFGDARKSTAPRPGIFTGSSVAPPPPIARVIARARSFDADRSLAREHVAKTAPRNVETSRKVRSAP